MSVWQIRQRPIVIAHRGASTERPENTLAAFALAEQQGADAIELDVLRCASGEVMVFHDDDLKRLAGRPEAIRELPLSELRHVRVGGEPIPTLAEVLAQVGASMAVNIELKPPARKGLEYLDSLRDDGLCGAVAALIVEAARSREEGFAERILVSSFDPSLLFRFRRAAPGIATGLLFHRDLGRPLRNAWAAPLLRGAAMHPEAKMVTRRNVRRWHAAGRAVNVWTVDDPHEIAYLSSVGVDGIITNFPLVARRVLERDGQAAG